MQASTAAASASTVTFASLLQDPGVTAAQLEAHLDALSSDERIAQSRALDGKLQKRLWEVAADGAELHVDDFVGMTVGDGVPVRFAGRNSLPMFTIFEKHFMRYGGVIVGINVQSMAFVTGPGYFTLRPAGASSPKEVLFDYTAVPAQAPPGWPAVKSNAKGLSRFVYKGLHDYNRRVSKDLVIGSATRLGKPMDSYYVLARMP